jgi:hypothetical protein
MYSIIRGASRFKKYYLHSASRWLWRCLLYYIQLHILKKPLSFYRGALLSHKGALLGDVPCASHCASHKLCYYAICLVFEIHCASHKLLCIFILAFEIPCVRDSNDRIRFTHCLLALQASHLNFFFLFFNFFT